METYLEKVFCFNIRDLQKMASSVSNLTETDCCKPREWHVGCLYFPKDGTDRLN